eukprot:5081174-Pyramimonas_sp.AAC.1
MKAVHADNNRHASWGDRPTSSITFRLIIMSHMCISSSSGVRYCLQQPPRNTSPSLKLMRANIGLCHQSVHDSTICPLDHGEFLDEDLVRYQRRASD